MQSTLYDEDLVLMVASELKRSLKKKDWNAWAIKE
jgi:hypothetical protein